MKISDLLKTLRNDVVLLTKLDVFLNYTEEAKDTIVMNHLGTSNFNDPALSYKLNSTIKTTSISFTIKTSTYENLVNITELLRSAYNDKAHYSLSNNEQIQLSSESSYFERYLKESRRHIATIDFTFYH